MATDVRYLALRFTIPAAGLAAMIALTHLYQFEPGTYHRVLTFMGKVPFHYPFLDLQNVLAWIDCWQRGVDVYVTNPCDVLDRKMDYPPLWLRFTFLPGKEWTNPLGLCLGISYFLALAVLPPPRSHKELLLRLIATLSPATSFAVERGNIDLLVFVIATAAGVLLLRPLRSRVVAYAMIVISGLLKFYPLVLMVLTVRERPWVFLWVNAAAAVVVLATGAYLHTEIVKMALNINMYNTGTIGAHYLPYGIAGILGTALHPGFSLRPVKIAIFAALFLAMAGLFFRMVSWRNFRFTLARLPEAEKMFLVIGAALIGGCFFTGTSNGYRAIHLLFTLPGLFAMAHMGVDMRVRRVAVQAYVLVVALTWADFFVWEGLFRQILASWIGNDASTAVVRFLRLLFQIAWWQVAVLFIVILIGCCLDWLEAIPQWRRSLRGPEAAQR
jgi:hypothetical protein